MTPEQGRVKAHFELLNDGTTERLEENEIDEFRVWLSEAWPTWKFPLDGMPNRSRTINYIISHYCRHKHNAWSEDWIRKNLSTFSLGTYAEWMEDLTEICKSHHFGYSVLVGHRFDPALAGAPSKIVHLRYLAVLLRMADILEFDPERTPDIIFQLRDIAPSSKVFWWKDHAISTAINDGQVTISARPRTAAIHKAIVVMCDEIDHELETCRRLAEETRFEKRPFPGPDLPHRWSLHSTVHRTIRPLADAYEYIEGSFRPHAVRLLGLLTSSSLYLTKHDAIRELL
jgi:hypothetical protein